MDPFARWQLTWSHLDEQPPPGLVEGLLAAYGEPHRAYHTLEHLAECFGHLDRAPLAPRDPAALELALWFHDAVYDPRADDSEARSAAWARAALGELRPELLARIEALILLTAHHAEPDDPDGALLLDLDLAILGAPRARYAQYEAQVRREYAWVPEEAYRRGRAEVLVRFARRPEIYRTEHFRARLEARARRNLERSLAALGAG